MTDSKNATYPKEIKWVPQEILGSQTAGNFQVNKCSVFGVLSVLSFIFHTEISLCIILQHTAKHYTSWNNKHIIQLTKFY